jgi:hypothetical protein
VRLQATQGKRVFYEGETIAYQVTTNQPGYLYLLVFSTGNRAALLLPNEGDKHNSIAAGVTAYPKAGYEFPVDATGIDIAVALVTSHPISGLDGARVDYTWSELFERLKLKQLQTAIENGAKSRGQRVQRTDIDWQAASVEVDTRKK